MRVLFIGGTGVISSACSEQTIERGVELFVLNRGKTVRELPSRAKLLKANAREFHSLKNAVEPYSFDAVVDWIAFTPEHIEMDYEVFQFKTRHFIFISSASAYQTPPATLPVTEETPLDNPYWQYSRDKIACEERLIQLHYERGFPVTIVRPSHTYDKTMLPCRGGWTTIDRMRRGQPVIIHGDGTSIWTLTHHQDFAKAFVRLLGRPQAIGEAFHITSDEWLTWTQIYELLAEAAGAELNPVYIPSTLINAYDSELGAGLLGDKMHSMMFDNEKIKKLVPDFTCDIPFARGAKEIIDWYDADATRQIINPEYNRITDRILSAYENAWP
mgnify:FL=1